MGTGVDVAGGTTTIVNNGTINATGGNGNAIVLGGGGDLLTNGTTGLIAGHRNGIDVLAAFGSAGNVTLVNAGTIIATLGAGIYLNQGGTVSNAGLIAAFDGTGVAIGGGAGAADVVVDNSATIAGNVGVQLGIGNHTLVNSGVIIGTGGTAVKFGEFGGGGGDLIIESGSRLSGAIGGFDPGDTIDLATVSFSSSASLTLEAGNVLRLVENGGTVTIDLDPNQNFAFDTFHAAGDGASGTDVTVAFPVVSSGHTLIVSSGTIANATVVSGGRLIVLPGATAQGTGIFGTEIVSSGGRDVDAFVGSGGRLYVESDGLTFNAFIASSGAEIVLGGGTADDTTIGQGAAENLSGTASGTTVGSGGRLNVLSHGEASATIVASGGSEVVFAGGAASGTTTIDGGLMFVSLDGSAANVQFTSGGELELATSTGFAGRISGFGGTDQLDLLFVPFMSGATTLSFTEAPGNTSGTLTVNGGGHVAHLTLLGSYTSSNFSIASDGHGGTLVKDPPVVAGGSAEAAAAFRPIGFADLDESSVADRAGLPDAPSLAGARYQAPFDGGVGPLQLAADGGHYTLLVPPPS